MKQQTYTLLTADEGKILTDGETYGRVIALGHGISSEGYYEITVKEYEAIVAEQAARREGGTDVLE